MDGGVAEARAIDVQEHVVRVRPIRDCLDGGGRVGGAALGRLRDAHDALDDVVLLTRPQRAFKEFGREAPIGRGNRLDLGARNALGRPGLIEIDVRALGGQHAFPAAQRERQSDDVRPGTR